MSRGHRNVTIRSGTSERHWYAIAGYLAVCILGVLVSVAQFAQGGQASMNSGGMTLALVIFGMAGGGILVMPSLFKDAAYVRDTRSRWKPKWWYYIGVPVGVGFAVYVGGSMLFPAFAGMTAFFLFVPVVFGSHAYYLYQRHQHVGVP